MSNTEPEKHLKYSPSKLHRILSCPHSANVEVEEVSNEAAEKGRRIHKYVASLLQAEDHSCVPVEHYDIVQPYVKHILANRAEEMLVETFWESKSIPEFGGTCDAALFVEDACAVYDLKTGKWPVEAIDNLQLLSYASIIQEHRPEINEFYGVIIQPKSSDGVTIKPVAEYSAEQLEQHRDRVRWAAGSDDLNTGSHCRFCPLRKAGLCSPGVQYCEKRGWK